MKRVAFISTAAAFVAAATAAAASVQGGAAKPLLRIADTDPLAVRGLHFRGGESVTVTARAGAPGERVVRARALRVAATGSFTVTFADIEATDCKLSVVARTASGLTVSLKVPPRPCGALP